MINVNHLTAAYKTYDGTVEIVKDCTFSIKDNEVFGIAGESGCGKSTLLKSLYDIFEYPLTITNGHVELVSNDKTKTFKSGDIRKAWWDTISYVPQAAMSVLNPIVRLRDQFADAIQDKTRDKNAIMAEVKKYLTELELPEAVLDAFPFQLSGGMRQRAIIAIATFMHPSVVLADEPTTALDVVVQRGILTILTRLQKQYKNTLVIVSHDMGVHYQITNRIGIMYAGSLAEIGKTEDMFERPQHPYTSMLINALPKVGDKGQKVGIPGAPPSFRNPPKGCSFAPRCPKCKEHCRNVIPKLTQIDSDHAVACHLYGSESEVK